MAALPAGITASVFQSRFDYGQRVLELEISNGTGAPITVTRASFESTRFATTAVWEGPQLIPDGSARDLRVRLTDPVCDGAAPRDRIVITFTLENDRNGTAMVTPTDEQGTVDSVNAQDCLDVSVARVATISAPAQAEWTPGARRPATIVISVVPTGAAGTVTIHRAKGTVLLSLIAQSNSQPYDMQLESVVDATAGPSVIALQVVPARCDPHAIEEDKRGTIFPLEVETSDGPAGTIYVAMKNEVRRSLYAFYSDYCGLP